MAPYQVKVLFSFAILECVMRLCNGEAEGREGQEKELISINARFLPQRLSRPLSGRDLAKIRLLPYLFFLFAPCLPVERGRTTKDKRGFFCLNSNGRFFFAIRENEAPSAWQSEK